MKHPLLVQLVISTAFESTALQITLSEKIAHSAVFYHLSHLSVDIQLSGLIKFREDSGVLYIQMIYR